MSSAAPGSPTRKLNWADMESDDELEPLESPREFFANLPAVSEVVTARRRSGKTAEEEEREREEQARVMVEEARLNKLKKAAAMAECPLWSPPTTPATARSFCHPCPHPASTPLSLTSFDTTRGRSLGAEGSATNTPASTISAATTPGAGAGGGRPAHRYTRWCRDEAVRQILTVLGSDGLMEVQELSKVLEWKRTFSRQLGSLYAFVKRECRGTLMYDPKGRVGRIDSLVFMQQQQQEQLQHRYFNGHEEEEEDGVTDEEPMSAFPTTPVQDYAASPEPLLSAADEINDIAASLLTMKW